MLKQGKMRPPKIIIAVIFLGFICAIPGCWDAFAEERTVWQVRLASLNDGRVHPGMTLEEFRKLWGACDDYSRSRFPDSVQATLIYHNYFGANGLSYSTPTRSYYFDFETSRDTGQLVLQSFHDF